MIFFLSFIFFSFCLLWLFLKNFLCLFSYFRASEEHCFSFFFIFLSSSKQQRWQSRPWRSVLIVGPLKRILITWWLEIKLWVGNTRNATLELPSACGDALTAWANFHHKGTEVWGMTFHLSLSCSFNIAAMNRLPG